VEVNIDFWINKPEWEPRNLTSEEFGKKSLNHPKSRDYLQCRGYTEYVQLTLSHSTRFEIENLIINIRLLIDGPIWNIEIYFQATVGTSWSFCNALNLKFILFNKDTKNYEFAVELDLKIQEASMDIEFFREFLESAKEL